MAVPTLAVTNTIQNGITADGDDVGQNFSDIETWAAACETAVEALEAADSSAVAKTVVSRGSMSTSPTSTVVSFTTETADTDGWWAAGAPTSLVCPANGVYAIALELEGTSRATYQYSVYLHHAATSTLPAITVPYTALSDNPDRISGGGVMLIQAGQAFNVRVASLAGGTATFVRCSIVTLATF